MTHILPVQTHPVALHTANFILSIPVVGVVTGFLSGVIPVLAALAALILYSLEIHDKIVSMRHKRDADARKYPRED